ncbi:MAG: c-type cytochrome [Bacteroidia bacterium]
MRKWQISALLLATIFITIGATTTKTNPPEGGFKNLKILPKDISEKQLHAIMREYSISLGVRCGFCHIRTSDSTKKEYDFASDAKDDKKIAREMMKMTAYLNANYFNFNNSTKPDTIHTVMCFTCHRGNTPHEKTVRSQLDSLIDLSHKKQ